MIFNQVKKSILEQTKFVQKIKILAHSENLKYGEEF
jgi:hypothetical protein